MFQVKPEKQADCIAVVNMQGRFWSMQQWKTSSTEVRQRHVLYVHSSEMAENENLQVGNGQSGGSGAPAVPSAGAESALQEWLTMLDSDGVAQPFPRSPKLQRKTNHAEKPSQVRTRPIGHVCATFVD